MTAQTQTSFDHEIQLQVGGMTCNHCAKTVSGALSALKGVTSAEASYVSGKVRLQLVNEVETQTLRQAIERAGYTLESDPHESPALREERISRRELGRFWWSLGWTLPVLLIHYLGWFEQTWGLWAAFGCATVLQPTSAIHFYRGAWSNLHARNLGMDVLVSLGIAAGYTYALLLMAGVLSDAEHAMPFFEAATLLICFVRLGKYLEARSRALAARAMNRLLNVTPDKVRKEIDGEFKEVAVEDLAVGDHFELRPGDRAPIDGVITLGESSIDEAVITGEALPREVGVGDAIVAGAMNHDRRLVVKATSTGVDSTLAKITDMVQRAQEEKAPSQRMADRVSNVFVPIVVAVAIGSGIFWTLQPDIGMDRVLTHVIGVLVIACPCALGLAVPAAIMIGSGACLRRGILIKSGEALENLSSINRIVFDKTGTLTQGKPEVSAVKTASDVQEEEVASLINMMASHSNHPLARAALKWAATFEDGSRAETAPSSAFEIKGKGLSLSRDGRKILFGSITMAQQSGVDAAELESFLADAPPGTSCSLLVRESKVLAAFYFTDPLIPGVEAVLKELEQGGIHFSLASGDRKEAVEAIAKSVGISSVHGEQLPENKLTLIKSFQDAGERVAFVGDGINDGPALSQADVGIVVANATDFAKHAGNIILLRPGITDVAHTLKIAKHTRSGIKQNLVLSLMYNALGIPLAAGLGTIFWAGMVIAPSYAALAMIMSDLSLFANCGRLVAKLRSLNPKKS